MQEKLLWIILMEMLGYKGVLSVKSDKISAPSLAHSLSLVHNLFFFKKMRYHPKIFYMRGLLEHFPPTSPTLFNYIEWVV
jgi:hypothetical protein